MNRFRKAISVGMSAALLASLFTITATAAFAAAPGFAVSGAGSIATDGTSGAVSIAVTEPAVNGWGAAGNTWTFTLTDAAGNGDPNIDWAGTPAISGAPGSLTGITASSALNILTVSFTASNITQIENFTISGLKVMTSGAAVGAVRVIVAKTAGAGTATVPSGTGTASGTLDNPMAAATTATGPITKDVGSFDFAVSDVNNGSLAFSDGASSESRAITVVNTQSAGAADLAVVSTGSFHGAGTPVSQSVSVLGLINGVATVVATLYTNVESSPTTVLPGEQNQLINTAVELGEPVAGTLKVGTVVTFKIDTAGVLFSGSGSLETSDIVLANGLVCPLSFDRTSCSVTVTAKSTYGSTYEAIELEDGYHFDVAASVPLGTKISINITTSQAGLPVVQNPGGSADMVVAVVGRVIVGVAASPTIFINYNDQATGMITLKESGAGFFTADTNTNLFDLCLTSGESFTRAPWAVVTIGDLKLRNGVVGASSVQGTLLSSGGNNCVEWTIYTASTVASTIEIRGSDASNVVLASGALNGPRLSVGSNLTPGPDAIAIDVMGPNNWTTTGLVTNAIRAYKSDIIVAAVSQPFIAAGSVAAPAGNITISETLAGQFKPGEGICVAVEPRSSNRYNQDTYFNTASTNMLPVITTNAASGLIVGAVMTNARNDCRDSSGNTYTDDRAVFAFPIVQQAFGPVTGVITIGNINLNVNADAPNGAVIIHVFKAQNQCENIGSISVSQFCSSGGVDFGAFVSNAKIGVAPVVPVGTGTATTRLGATQLGAFTVATKIAKVGKYVTYRFDFGVAAAGQLVKVWGATKSGNDWSAFSVVTSRVANASGVVYYYIRQSAPSWKSYRAMWTGGNAWTPARQARWIS